VTIMPRLGDQPPAPVQADIGALRRHLAETLRSKVLEENLLIAPGDFNIGRKDDRLWQAFTSTGLAAPKGSEGLRRSICTAPGERMTDRYDYWIAFFAATRGHARLSRTDRRGGRVDVPPYV
jgi:hypothetical protein